MPSQIGEHVGHVEQGKDEKHQTTESTGYDSKHFIHDSRHCVYDSKHPIGQVYDLKHSIYCICHDG